MYDQQLSCVLSSKFRFKWWWRSGDILFQMYILLSCWVEHCFHTEIGDVILKSLDKDEVLSFSRNILGSSVSSISLIVRSRERVFLKSPLIVAISRCSTWLQTVFLKNCTKTVNSLNHSCLRFCFLAIKPSISLYICLRCFSIIAIMTSHSRQMNVNSNVNQNRVNLYQSSFSILPF